MVRIYEALYRYLCIGIGRPGVSLRAVSKGQAAYYSRKRMMIWSISKPLAPKYIFT